MNFATATKAPYGKNAEFFMLPDYRGKKVVVMGLGLLGGGVVAARFFSKQGARVLVTDLKTQGELAVSVRALTRYKNIRFVFGKHREEDFQNADLIIQNPGVPGSSPYLEIARREKIHIETDVSFMMKYCPAFTIGITGTKGKTTITALIAQIMPHALVGGNIGVSVFSLLPKLSKNSKQIVVLELSSWQLESLKNARRSPQIAVISNIFPDHLNRYKNFTAYKNAKKLIFRYQKTGDYLIVNAENAEARGICSGARSKVFLFGGTKAPLFGVFLRDGWIVFSNAHKTERVVRVDKSRLKGAHNKENVMAAVCVAKILGAPNRIIAKAVYQFQGVPHRMEVVGMYKGVVYYNDTASTVPEATIRAVQSLAEQGSAGRIVLIAGGSDKKLNYGEFAVVTASLCKNVILYKGADSDTATDKMFEEYAKRGFRSFVLTASLKEALNTAAGIAKKGESVLFSPGASSFGKFVNEFDRGAQFVREVRRLF